MPNIIHIDIFFFEKRKIKTRNGRLNIEKANKYVKLINYRNSDNKTVYVKKVNGPKGIFL